MNGGGDVVMQFNPVEESPQPPPTCKDAQTQTREQIVHT